MYYSGAAIWTVIINKDSFVNKVKVEGGKSLGITVSAGPALCESRVLPRSARLREARLTLCTSIQT